MMAGDSTFAAVLHGQLRATPGNLFYSPASVRLALTMASAGARGTTATEMQSALALPPDGTAHATLRALRTSWNALAHPPVRYEPDNEWHAADRERIRVVLRVVNRMWAQRGHAWNEEFLAVLRDCYDAPLGEVDFRDDAARAAINAWVAEATEHKIEHLLTKPLAPDTRLVLTNAIYFKAKWATPFVESQTAQGTFVTATGDVTAPLMHRVGHAKLAQLHDVNLLELPYGDGRLAMTIVLPTARDGIAAIEAQYGRGEFVKWTSKLSPAYVDITLPRFRSSSTLQLSDALRAMGMPSAFAYPGADFSGIDGTRELFIGSVVHRAVIDVDEHGTEAAAATALDFRAGSARPPAPVVFRADHPFLFVIRDTVSDVVLFAGRLADPTAD